MSDLPPLPPTGPIQSVGPGADRPGVEDIVRRLDTVEQGLRLPGGQHNPAQVIEGLEGLVASLPAALEEARNVIQESHTLAQRTATYYGDAERSAEQAHQLTQDAARQQRMAPGLPTGAGEMSLAERAEQIMGGGGPPPPPEAPKPTPLPPPERPPGAFQAVDESQLRNITTRQPGLPVGAAGGGAGSLLDVADWGEDPLAAFRQGRGMRLGDLRQGVARQTLGRISEWQYGDLDLVQDAAGNWMHTEASAGPTGALATAAQVGTFARNQRITGAVRNAVGNIAEGGTVSGGLGAMVPRAARFAGVAGLAVGAINTAGNFLETQRAQNAQYQAMLGGTNVAGLGQRAQQELFEFSQFGRMQNRQAEQLFRGVTETGLQGGERQAALDFATGQYGQTGQSVAQSLQMIQAALQRGSQDFDSFARSLQGVTAAAREAGLNTEEMRARFIRSFQQMGETIADPVVARQAAEAQVIGQARLGRRFQDEQLFATDETAMRRVAAQMGIPYHELVSRQNGPNGAIFQAEIQQVQLEQGRQSVFFGQEAQVRTFAEQWIRNNTADGSIQNMDDTDWQELTQAVQDNFDVDTGIAQRAAQDAGVTPRGPMHALEVLLRNMLGQYNPVQEARAVQRREREQLQGGGVQRGRSSTGTRLAQAATGNIIAAVRGDELTESQRALRERVGLDPTESLSTGIGARVFDWGGGGDDPARAYVAAAERRGHDLGVAELLINRLGDLGNTRFEVEIEGEKRALTWEELLRYAPNKLATGEARIISPEGEGRTIADFLNKDPATLRENAPREWRRGAGERVEDPGDIGISATRAQREVRERIREGEGSGRFVVEPSDTMKEWISIARADMGLSANTNGARQAGTTPDGFPPADQYPTG